MRIFGVKLIGVSALGFHKLLLSLVFVSVILLLRRAVVRLVRFATGKRPNERLIFWTRQVTSVSAAFLIVVSVLSIWFDDPARMATGLGLFSAGLAFALQKVITSFAGYLVIMRGKTFSVGDRITLGGVRGDVISLGFLQTRIMEMGEPPSVQSADPAMWVRARQYTGRIVTVTNDKIFDEPVYNFTREFPYLWEEMVIPIPYTGGRVEAEKILLEAAHEFTDKYKTASESGRHALEARYFIRIEDLDPKVYYRLTDNWIELTLRFVVPEHGIREVKDHMSRRIIERFEQQEIGIASSTYDIVGFPPLKIERVRPPRRASAA